MDGETKNQDPRPAPPDGRGFVVTGGAGFIGRHLTDTLLDAGAHVTVIDDGSGGDVAALAPLIDAAPDRFRLIRGSVLDPIALDHAMEGAHTVVHLAALVSVHESIEQPSRYAAVNAMGTAAAIAGARRAGAKRFVYASTAAAYGEPVETPIAETHRLSPVSPYAATKLSGEHMVHAAAATLGLPAVSLRFFNVFGEGQPADTAYASVVPAFIRAVLSDTRPSVFGDGEQTRDFVHVDNVVDAIVSASSLPDEHPALAGGAFNVASGTPTTVRALAAAVAELAGVPHLKPEIRPARAGDVRHSHASIAHAEEHLAYRVRVSLEEGLTRTIEHARRTGGNGSDTPSLRLAE